MRRRGPCSRSGPACSTRGQRASGPPLRLLPPGLHQGLRRRALRERPRRVGGRAYRAADRHCNVDDIRRARRAAAVCRTLRRLSSNRSPPRPAARRRPRRRSAPATRRSWPANPRPHWASRSWSAAHRLRLALVRRRQPPAALLLLTLVEACFLLGNLAGEKALGERIYGSHDPPPQRRAGGEPSLGTAHRSPTRRVGATERLSGIWLGGRSKGSPLSAPNNGARIGGADQRGKLSSGSSAELSSTGEEFLEVGQGADWVYAVANLSCTVFRAGQ